MIQITKKEIQKIEKNIHKFIKTNKRLPNYADINRGKNKIRLTPLEYSGLFHTIYNFRYHKGRYPNYATVNLKRNEPTILKYQTTPYTCCPTSISMALTKFFKYTEEKEIAKLIGTTKNGTSPKKMMKNAYKLKITINRIPRNKEAVQKALNNYEAVITHYETKAARCSGFLNNYGHYALIQSIKGDKYIIYDPTKGIYTCHYHMMDKATHGRNIGYYTIKPW